MNLKYYIKIIRLHHWIKNLFIFIPLVFAGELFNLDKFNQTFLVTFCFCLVTGFVYILNDIFDREYDKSHPSKKFRPIAAGQIAVKNAIAFGFILLSIGFVIIAFYKSELIFLFALYVVLNIGYSIKVKAFQ